jgi:hypothetical protein
VPPAQPGEAGEIAVGGHEQGVQLDGDGRQIGVGDQYAALDRLLTLSPDFEFDLVDLDACAAELRAAILARGVSL